MLQIKERTFTERNVRLLYRGRVLPDLTMATEIPELWAGEKIAVMHAVVM